MLWGKMTQQYESAMGYDGDINYGFGKTGVETAQLGDVRRESRRGTGGVQADFLRQRLGDTTPQEATAMDRLK